MRDFDPAGVTQWQSSCFASPVRNADVAQWQSPAPNRFAIGTGLLFVAKTFSRSSSVVEQCFRKAKAASSNLASGSKPYPSPQKRCCIIYFRDRENNTTILWGAGATKKMPRGNSRGAFFVLEYLYNQARTYFTENSWKREVARFARQSRRAKIPSPFNPLPFCPPAGRTANFLRGGVRRRNRLHPVVAARDRAALLPRPHFHTNR